MRWNLRGHSRSASIALNGRFHRSSLYWCARRMRSIRPSQHTYSKILAYEIGRSASRRARHGSRLVAMNITRWSQSLVGAAHSEAASSRTDAVLFIQTRSHFQEKEKKKSRKSQIYEIYAKRQDLQDLRRKFYTSGPAAVGIFTNSCRRQNFMTRRSTPCSVTSASTCAPLMSRRQNAARPLRSSAFRQIISIFLSYFKYSHNSM